MKKIIIVLFFSLLKISAYSQNKNFKCTKDNYEDDWLTQSFESFNLWLEDEKTKVNKESYWLFGSGDGEVSTYYSALIIPMKQKTIIYQHLLDKQIVNEVITIEYLSRYLKKLNKKVESNVIHNAKYFVIKADNKGQSDCVNVFYSVDFPPEKNNNDSLIDFNRIIIKMNQRKKN